MPRFRPRLKFSLRALFFLVTVLCSGLIWFARECRIVRERKAVRELVDLRIGGPPAAIQPVLPNRDATRSWIRAILNDPIEYGRVFPAAEIALMERFQRAFPESVAAIYWEPQFEDNGLITDEFLLPPFAPTSLPVPELVVPSRLDSR